MPLKNEMIEKSLFRQCKNTMKNIQIFDEQALIDSILRSQIINLESVIDMKLFIDSYIFRHDNEQVLDNSSR